MLGAKLVKTVYRYQHNVCQIALMIPGLSFDGFVSELKLPPLTFYLPPADVKHGIRCYSIIFNSITI